MTEQAGTPTVGELVRRGAARHPDRAAIVVSDQRRTYGELAERVDQVARSLLRLGVGAGDRVGILMPNSVDFLEVEFACAVIGAVVVPVNSRFRSTELRHVLPDAGVRVLLVSDLVEDQVSYIERLVETFPAIEDHDADLDAPLSLPEAPALEHVVILGRTRRAGFLPGERFDAGAGDVDGGRLEELRGAVGPDDPFLTYYTSGTTALPKGCVLTHAAVVRQGVLTGERLGYRDGDVMFSPLPMFHTGCTQFLVGILERGGTYVSMTRFDAGEGLDLIAQEGATLLVPAFPAITDALVDHPRFSTDLFDDVRVLFHIATPDQLRQLQARLPSTVVVSAFGMTEFAGSIAVGDPAHPLERRLHSGPALPGCEIVILDLVAGTPVAAGVEGQIAARGPTLFSGYHGAPERTAESFTADGYFLTGDLGVLDEHGDLRFRGRLKDMLKIGGENVGAIEIESFLESHPKVQLANVVGVPDERLGEVAAAFVQLRPGAEATEAEIIDHCRGRIASYKVPRYVRFVTCWPMSATKVRKGDLREMIASELQVAAP